MEVKIASCTTDVCSFSDAFVIYGIIALVDNQRLK